MGRADYYTCTIPHTHKERKSWSLETGWFRMKTEKQTLRNGMSVCVDSIRQQLQHYSAKICSPAVERCHVFFLQFAPDLEKCYKGRLWRKNKVTLQLIMLNIWRRLRSGGAPCFDITSWIVVIENSKNKPPFDPEIRAFRDFRNSVKTIISGSPWTSELAMTQPSSCSLSTVAPLDLNLWIVSVIKFDLENENRLLCFPFCKSKSTSKNTWKKEIWNVFLFPSQQLQR